MSSTFSEGEAAFFFRDFGAFAPAGSTDSTGSTVASPT